MAIYNEKLYKLNRFEPKKLPSARQLFQKYGPSMMRQQSGHPDNTDPYHFSTPGNISGVIPNSGGIALGMRFVEAQMAADEANRRAAEAEKYSRQSADGVQASEGEAEG